MSRLKKEAREEEKKENKNETLEPVEVEECVIDEINDQSAEEIATEDILEQCKSENEKLREQYLKLAADFDNYRKRMTRQMQDNSKFANEQILESLIEVVDNLERAINAADENEKNGSLIKGIENVHRQFLDKLANYGLNKVEAEADMEFDPKYHEAVVCVPLEEGKKEGTISEVFLNGYELNGKLIRPANVSVREEH